MADNYKKKSDENYTKDYDVYAAAGTLLSVGGVILGTGGRALASYNQKKAEKILNESYQRYAISYENWKKQSDAVKEAVSKVVDLKRQILVKHLKKLLKAYKRLSLDMELKDSRGLEEIKRLTGNSEEIRELKETIRIYKSYNGSKFGEKASELAICMVQDGTVENLVNSFDGIAKAVRANDEQKKRILTDDLKVQSIGVIQQVSVLAVGYGMEGVSNAFATGKQLNEAKEIAAQYDQEKVKLDIYTVKNQAIYQYAKIHEKLLCQYIPLVEKSVSDSVNIIRAKDNFFHIGKISGNKFTEDEWKILAYTCSLAETMKGIIDSPIIGQDGDVYHGNTSDFDKAQSQLQEYRTNVLPMLPVT